MYHIFKKRCKSAATCLFPHKAEKVIVQDFENMRERPNNKEKYPPGKSAASKAM
jgi:hypothetical protein